MAMMRWGALALAAGLFSSVAGCDKSKAALESTQTQLATALAERDSYKQRLDAALAQLNQAQTQLALIKAAAAASPPPPAPAAPASGSDVKPPPSPTKTKTD